MGGSLSPATLTRGDEVNFPVAVYNYLDTAQTVRVEMQTADWFTPLGATGIDIDLGPGQVTGVRIPVRVDKVGRPAEMLFSKAVTCSRTP